MEATKRFLNIAIGISVILLSLSLLIFSAKGNTANAQSGSANSAYHTVGVIGEQSDGVVIGYNPGTGDAKVIARYHR